MPETSTFADVLARLEPPYFGPDVPESGVGSMAAYRDACAKAAEHASANRTPGDNSVESKHKLLVAAFKKRIELFPQKRRLDICPI